ncbi:MAG: membrane protein insertion efficiency factor YidD [Deltaproteobacteria bacterium]|nr:membrane protein insertion efficiency factor YidD [Deltaproteobacteria bacterium]
MRRARRRAPEAATTLRRPAEAMVARILVLLVRIYQLTLSRLILFVLGPVCRFEPSCSHYAVACLRAHGAWRGSLLSLRRLSKCHPFHPGGYDPPPPGLGRPSAASASQSVGSDHGAPRDRPARTLGHTGQP